MSNKPIQTIKLSPETTDPPASSAFTAPAVGDGGEAYIPIRRKPEFDMEAFRAKVEELIDDANRDDFPISYLVKVLALLPPKPQPPTPEEVINQALLISIGDDLNRAVITHQVSLALRKAGWLRDEHQTDRM